MTVASATSRKTFAGNGSTTSFDTSPIVFFETSNLVVYVSDDATGEATTLVENTDYTVTGGDGAVGTISLAGGSSPYGAPAVDTTLVILRQLPILQETDFVQNDGSDAEVQEESLDRIIMILQQHDEELGRTLRVPVADGIDGELQTIVDRASKVLGFDADGVPVAIANVPTSGVAATAFGEVLLTATGVVDAKDELGLPVLSPEDYDAVGDGSVDDTTAFSNLLTAAEGAYRVVLKPGKTYLLTTWTPFSNASKLIIDGNGATIKGPASTVNFLTPAANFDIRGVTFDRWAAVVERLTAQSGSFTDVRFENNTVTACTGVAFNIERPIENYWITKNRFYSNTGGYCVRIGTNTYADQDTWLKGVVAYNTFKTTSATSSTSCAAIILYGKDTVVLGNHIDGISADSGEGWGIYTKLRFSVVANNTIRNVKSTSSTDVVGISLKGVGRGVTSSPQGFRVACIGNSVYDVGVNGTKGTGIRSQCDDHIIANNLIEDPGAAGIQIDSPDQVDVVVTGNKITYSAISTTYGIRVLCDGNRITVSDNTIYNANVCIDVIPDPSALDGCTIQGNTLGAAVVAASTAINVTPTNTTNNLAILNNTVVQAENGIVFNAGTMNYTRIEGNDFRRASVNVFNGSIPAGTRIRSNRGYLSEAGGVSAAITSGSTIAHGMPATPVSVVVSASGGSPTAISVTSIGSSTFTVNWTGGGSIAWYWEAKLATHFTA